MANLFDFQFTYNDYEQNGASGGSYYFGTVVDDGTFGYRVGEVIPFSAGGAHDGTFTITHDLGSTTQPVGAVNDYFYWDGTGTDQGYIPFYSATQGHSPVTGNGGLGTDRDYIASPDGLYHYFSAGVEAAL